MDNKEIRFIDSHYNELFRIPDGGQILITTVKGDKIRANSFGSSTTNGHPGNVNGIRITYLLDGEIVSTLSTADVYNEYTANGYVTVPDGVDEVNVAWWKPSISNYLYINE